MAPEICILIFREIHFRHAVSIHTLNLGVITTSLPMRHMYLVNAKISPLGVSERTPWVVFMKGFYLKEKNRRQQEKDRKGKHVGTSSRAPQDSYSHIQTCFWMKPPQWHDETWR